MIERWPEEVARVFEEGSFCHVAVSTRFGPHLTPMVFAPSGDRVWLTTARGSVKARAWRRALRVSGMVRGERLAVAFAGLVRLHDALDPVTWRGTLERAPALAAAAVRFTKKNARFYAGYAVDAKHVPLAWTPPGRVFAEVSLDRAALVDDHGVVETWGAWKESVTSLERFRASRKQSDPLRALPSDVREPLGVAGLGAVAVEGAGEITTLPARWAAGPAGLFAALPAPVLGLAGLEEPAGRVALTVERASWWRASRMVGAMAQGGSEVFAIELLASGARSAAAVARETGADAQGSALVRILPSRLVWWRGWASGAVAL